MRGFLSRVLGFATVDTRPLGHRDFRLLFFGQLVSFLGTEFTEVAIPFQVYQLTHSAFAVGLVGLVQLGPVLAFAFLGGALADARDRRAMVLLTELAFTLLSLLLLVNALLPRPLLVAVYVIAAFQAGLFALQRPSLQAMLPRLVPTEELTAAGALGQVQGGTGLVVGPAIAGVVIALGGLPAGYAVDVVSFGASLGALALMRAMPPALEAERPSLRRVREGLAYAWSRPELLGTYLVDMVAMVFGFPTALFPAVASVFGGPAVLGLLFSAPAVGGLLTSLSSGWTSRVNRHGWGVIVGATGWGLAITAFGFAPTLPLALAFLALAGAGDSISGIFRQVIWNQTIPDSLRGRLASIELLSYTSGPLLGNFESGVVASLFSVRASIVSGGLLCVAGCALCAALLPGFRSYDARARAAGTRGPDEGLDNTC
jgi:MFS family permease